MIGTTYEEVPEADLEPEEVLPAEVAVPLEAAPDVAPVEIAPAEADVAVAIAVSVELPPAAEELAEPPFKQLLSAVKGMSVGRRL